MEGLLKLLHFISIYDVLTYIGTLLLPIISMEARPALARRTDRMYPHMRLNVEKICCHKFHLTKVLIFRRAVSLAMS